MESNPLQTQVSLVWEIKNFPLYVDLHENELESPPFLVRCTEVISFFLTIRLRDDILDCFLYRLNRVDNLGDIYIKYMIFVIGPNESMLFPKGRCSIKVPKDIRSVKIFDFLDTRLIQAEHIPRGKLRLQLNLEVSINDNETIPWNFNEGLRALSRDMVELYNDMKYSNKCFWTHGMDFPVHSFVIDARCPRLNAFEIDEIPIDRSARTRTNRLENFPGIQSMTTLLTLPPKSNFVKRPDRKYLRHDEEVEEDDQDDIHWLSFDTLIRYLYSGQLSVGLNKPLDDTMRGTMLRLARLYNLTDLVHKLQEVASKSTVVTEMQVDKVALDFDLGFLKYMKEKYFEPITRFINLSSTDKLYMSVTFSVVRDVINMLHISCELTEFILPATIKTEILIFNNEFLQRGPLERFENTRTICDHKEIWSPVIDVIVRGNVYIRCIFSVCRGDKVEITRQEFSLSSADYTESRSLRKLSNDFATAFMRSTEEGDNLTDFTLVAQGKEHRVHKCMMYGRVPEVLQMLSDGKTLNFTNCESKTLQDLIEYVYTGMLLDKDPTNVEKLLEIAQNLKLPELINICNAFLKMNKP